MLIQLDPTGDPGPGDLSQTLKDVFGAVSDAANGGEHATTDVGQVFTDIGKLIADEANDGHTGDSKVVSGDIDHTVKDLFQALSDAGKGGEHAVDGFGKVAGDLGKLVNDLGHDGNQPDGSKIVNYDLEDDGHQPGNQHVPQDHSNGTAPVDQHNGDLQQGGMSNLGDVHGFDAHLTQDAHVLHH